jgi:hypothetical protein
MHLAAKENDEKNDDAKDNNMKDNNRYLTCSSSITTYMKAIAGSATLATRVKVDLLRARMRGMQSTKACTRRSTPAGLPSSALGPQGDTPFFGLSAIDSLLHDKLRQVLRGYMDIILESPLTDEEKFQVLRLDYDHRDRQHLNDVSSASEAYRNKIHFSTLPQGIKDRLINSLPGSYGYCSVM